MQARMKHPLFILPDAMQALVALDKAAAPDGLPSAIRNLVQLRASQINGCSLCADMHGRELKKSRRERRAYLRGRGVARGALVHPTPSARLWL